MRSAASSRRVPGGLCRPLDSARGSPPPVRGYRNIVATWNCPSAMTAALSLPGSRRASSRITPRPKRTCRSRAGATTGGGCTGSRTWAKARSWRACRSTRQGTSAVRETIRTPSSRRVRSSVRNGSQSLDAPRWAPGAISGSPPLRAPRTAHRTGPAAAPGRPRRIDRADGALGIFRCERRQPSFDQRRECPRRHRSSAALRGHRRGHGHLFNTAGAVASTTRSRRLSRRNEPRSACSLTRTSRSAVAARDRRPPGRRIRGGNRGGFFGDRATRQGDFRAWQR